MLLNLYKNNPAKEEPRILTNIVEMGNPYIDILEIVIKYLKLDPVVAPTIRAI